MDLRIQNSHVHYIHVIKKGTVVELMNQSPSGVPAQKFRDINDIYDDQDSLRDITLSGCNLGSGASDADCSNRNLVCSTGASLWEDPFSDDAARRSKMDDSISDELTLQKLWKKHKKKGKKRKTPESGFRNEMSATSEKHLVSQADDDLMLPLSCLMSNVLNKRRVKVVEDLDLSSPIQNVQVDFDKYEEAPLDEYHQQEIESTTQHSSLASTALHPSCSHNKDDNSDCGLNPVNLNSTTVDIPGETAASRSSQGSKMMMEEHAGSLFQNLESLNDCLVTYTPCLLTVHNKTENKEYLDGACQSPQLGNFYDLPVTKFSFQEDDSAKPFSNACMYAVSPSMDLACEMLDRFKPQPFTNEICSQAGKDPITFPRIVKANVEAQVSTMPGLVCKSVQQLSQSPPIVLYECVQECIHVTTLPDACLHAPSNSVDHRSGEDCNSEPFCIESKLDSLAVENPVTNKHSYSNCIESKLDPLDVENPVSDEHDNSEPCCAESEMDSLAVKNLVKYDIRSVRFTNNEKYLPSSEEICQSFQAELSHLPESEANVKEDTCTEYLLDLPSDSFTSPSHTSDNNDLMNMHSDFNINLADQVNPVNQEIDDRFVVSPEYEVDIEKECLHVVKETIDGIKTSSPRDSLIINSTEGRCESASSTLSCYSDSCIPTTRTAQDDELLSATSCSVTETSKCMSTGSCDSLDKPLAPGMIFSERKDTSLSLQNKLWSAMENIDTIDSREKLRSLVKLVSENQIKKKKRTAVKGNEIKGYEKVNKSDIFKQSVSKRSGSALELNHSGIKVPRLLSYLGRDKKMGQCIPSSPEGAILFSKKQMRDFEVLAYKLTRELASMKEIMEERLNHEAGTPDHINDQVITAINKASKVEQTARKRLSTMNRDCIRFCTIMKTSENNSKDSANSESTVQKRERKKIKFADEAGGQLCQIMFIENS